MPTAFSLVTVQNGFQHQVGERLRSMEGVRWALRTLGAYDLVARLDSPSLEALGDLVLRLITVSGVISTETLVAFKGTGCAEPGSLILVKLTKAEKATAAYEEVRGNKWCKGAWLVLGSRDLVICTDRVEEALKYLRTHPWVRDAEPLFSQ